MRSRIALLIGGGRAALGLAFAVNPSQSMRFLGVDQATARRLEWLAQMAAARDIALGLGTIVATRSDRGANQWLLAGAACDAADAAAIANAVRRHQLAPIVGAGVVMGAIAATAAAVWAVLNSRDGEVTP